MVTIIDKNISVGQEIWIVKHSSIVPATVMRMVSWDDDPNSGRFAVVAVGPKPEEGTEDKRPMENVYTCFVSLDQAIEYCQDESDLWKREAERLDRLKQELSCED